MESHENLDQLDTDLVALEQEPDSRERLSSIFRTIHTIKGTSGFLAFNRLEAVTHVGENLLSRLRDGELELTPTRRACCCRWSTPSARCSPPSRPPAVRAPSTSPPSSPPSAPPWRTPRARYLLDPLRSRPPARPPPRSRPPPVAAREGPARQGGPPRREGPRRQEGPRREARPRRRRRPPAARKAAAAEGRVPSPWPRCRGPGRRSAGGRATSSSPLSRPGGEAADRRGCRPAAEPPSSRDAAPVDPNGQPRRAVADSTIRVDVGLLDKLMNLVGELVLARNQIVQHVATRRRRRPVRGHRSGST